MDLGLTEAQEILKTTAANFIQQEYPKETLIALESTPTGMTPELFRKVAELGWLGIVIPEVYGGEWVNQARELCQVVQSGVHRFLWFVGD